MEDGDEYDAYNIILDIEDIPYLTSPVATHAAAPEAVLHESAKQTIKPFIEDNNYSPTFLKSGSSDTYSDYDFSEFTEQDFALIDASLSSAVPPGPSRLSSDGTLGTPEVPDNLPTPGADGPAVTITAEESTQDGDDSVDSNKEAEDQGFREPLSPFDGYRGWNGTLSVTDLTGPIWCEVQFDYGLRQRRSRKLEDRPTTFVSAKGKTISVNHSIAAGNDRVVKRGRSVHKVLEREIHPEERIVEVTIPEERWALRLVNMIGSIDSLLGLGRCREMPVFGLIHDQVVVGIIDEVERTPIPEPVSDSPTIKANRLPGKRSVPSTPTKLNAKKPRSSPQPDQPAITAFFRHIPQQLEEAPGVTIPDIREEHVRPSTPPNEPVTSKTRRRCTPPPNYRLHVSDTKTRKHNSMPSDDDTLSSKLQLMLYHRLLSNLLVRPSRTTTGLDFGQFWVRLGLDPKRTLSKTFLVQAGLVSPEEDPQTALLKCLEDLVGAWRIAVDTLHVDGIDQTLSVVYRTQPKRGSRKKARSPGSSPSPSDQEKADLARAIAASLQDTDSNQDGDDLAKAIEASLKNDNTNSGNAPSDPEEVLVVDDAQTKKPSGAVATSSIQHHPQEDGQKEEGDRDTEESEESLGEGSVIIGKKPVQLDDALLDYHLSNVLDWWFGRRPPRGVDIRHTRRCMWCEYREGCEWREQKAFELMNKANGKRTVSKSVVELS